MTLKSLGYKPREQTVRIVFDDSLRRAADAAKDAVVRQRREEAKDGQGLGSQVPELEEAWREAEAAADEAAVSFTFRAVGRRRLADLVAECPPTAEQLERWKERVRTSPVLATAAPEFDYERFAPRLIAASLVEPAAAPGEVLELWDAEDGWSDAVWAELWKAAWEVNQEAATRPTSGTGTS